MTDGSSTSNRRNFLISQTYYGRCMFAIVIMRLYGTIPIRNNIRWINRANECPANLRGCHILFGRVPGYSGSKEPGETQEFTAYAAIAMGTLSFAFTVLAFQSSHARYLTQPLQNPVDPSSPPLINTGNRLQCVCLSSALIAAHRAYPILMVEAGGVEPPCWTLISPWSTITIPI